MVRQTKLDCLPLTTGQEHSRAQSSQCSWHMRIFVFQKLKTVTKAEDSLSPVPATKNQTCLKNKPIH